LHVGSNFAKFCQVTLCFRACAVVEKLKIYKLGPDRLCRLQEYFAQSVRNRFLSCLRHLELPNSSIWQLQLI